MKNKNTYMGQTVIGTTTLFNQTYFWMKDGDGTIYLTKVGEDGLPSFT